MSVTQLNIELGVAVPVGADSMLIEGVECRRCEVCDSFHPAKPFFDESAYHFYDSRCWVVDQNKGISKS